MEKQVDDWMHRWVAPADSSAQSDLHILFLLVKLHHSLRPESNSCLSQSESYSILQTLSSPWVPPLCRNGGSNRSNKGGGREDRFTKHLLLEDAGLILSHSLFY